MSTQPLELRKRKHVVEFLNKKYYVVDKENTYLMSSDPNNSSEVQGKVKS